MVYTFNAIQLFIWRGREGGCGVTWTCSYSWEGSAIKRILIIYRKNIQNREEIYRMPIFIISAGHIWEANFNWNKFTTDDGQIILSKREKERKRDVTSPGFWAIRLKKSVPIFMEEQNYILKFPTLLKELYRYTKPCDNINSILASLMRNLHQPSNGSFNLRFST